MYFYPAASTPGCTKEAGDFRDNLHDLSEAGLDVVGISPTHRPSWPSSVMPRG
ncbi:redoxin family protein [Mycobacterium xenopi 4042]|uniref:Redoxin family protein n=1 Tax=Mycobacterium xenopi 4042 TaxID=1299334 RepID=X8AMF4_MYCXE|nr:redoxin family protein [Mycobacterium xenopi 4042]